MEEASTDFIQVPIGRWAKDKRMKEMGLLYGCQFVEAIDAFSLALYTRVLGYTYEQTLVIIANVK